MQFTAKLLVSALCSTALAAPASLSESNALIARADPGVVQGNGLFWYDADFSHGTNGLATPSQYTCFSGPSKNFPAKTRWMNFNAAWALQSKLMQTYANDTAQQLAYMYDAIVAISKNSKVDARVILAVIRQESGGRVNVGCTDSNEGVHNCGLMQAYNSHPYNPAAPKRSITLMIQEGTQGTASGPGLAQDFNQPKSAGNVYNVFRIYNSGLAALNTTNLSIGGGATNTYVTDVANRLLGWDGSDPKGAQSACATKLASQNPTPTPTPSTCGPSKYVSTPANAAAANQRCCSWYTVQSGDYCAKITQAFGITLSQLYTWNPEINSDCTNLMLGSGYCVSSDQAAA